MLLLQFVGVRCIFLVDQKILYFCVYSHLVHCALLVRSLLYVTHLCTISQSKADRSWDINFTSQYCYVFVTLVKRFHISSEIYVKTIVIGEILRLPFQWCSLDLEYSQIKLVWFLANSNWPVSVSVLDSSYSSPV